MVKVRVFGEFRNWVQSGEMILDPSQFHTVADFKKGLKAEILKSGKLSGAELDSLMDVSVLAEDSRILRESEIISELRASSFALLPPVCGG